MSIILESWPEHMLEKYLDNVEAGGGSSKFKGKLGVETKNKRGGRSKQRGMKDGKIPATSSNLKSGDAKRTLQEFLQSTLTDASAE